MNSFNEDTLAHGGEGEAKKKETRIKHRVKETHERHAVKECLICNLLRCNQRPLLFYLMKIHSEKYYVAWKTNKATKHTLYVYRSHSLPFIKLYIQVWIVLFIFGNTSKTLCTPN